jgi:hypothetical protein
MIGPQDSSDLIHLQAGANLAAERGVVAHSHPNMGMGVKFIALESGCASLLETWLNEVAIV